MFFLLRNDPLTTSILLISDDLAGTSLDQNQGERERLDLGNDRHRPRLPIRIGHPRRHE